MLLLLFTGGQAISGTADGLIDVTGTASGTHDAAIITGTGIGTAVITATAIGIYGGVPSGGETRQYIIAGGVSFFVNETTDDEVQLFATQVSQIGSGAAEAITGTAAGDVFVTADAVGLHVEPIFGTAVGEVFVTAAAVGAHFEPITGTASGEVFVTAAAAGTHFGTAPRLSTSSRSRRLDPSVRRPIAPQVRRAQAHYPTRRRASDTY